MSGCTRTFDGTECVYFLIEITELLEKFNNICDKVINSTETEFDSKLAQNEKYLKSKIKPYGGKANATFHDGKMSNKGSHYVFLSMIVIDFVLKNDKNNY